MDKVDSLNVEVMNKNNIKVTWNEVDGNFDKYIVNCTSLEEDGASDSENIPKGNETEYVCKNLTPGTSYSVTVTTYLTADNQETSDAKQNTTSTACKMFCVF